MKFDMKSLMKQAEQMKEMMAKKQEELGRRTFEANAGGGMVTAIANGKHELIKIVIDPSIVSPDDVEMLQDLVTAAVNESFKKANDAVQQEMSGMLGGLGDMQNML